MTLRKDMVPAYPRETVSDRYLSILNKNAQHCRATKFRSRNPSEVVPDTRDQAFKIFFRESPQTSLRNAALVDGANLMTLKKSAVYESVGGAVRINRHDVPV